jgi:hypothetical protein
MSQMSDFRLTEFSNFSESRVCEVPVAGKLCVSPARWDLWVTERRLYRRVLSVSYVGARVARDLAIHKNGSAGPKL